LNILVRGSRGCLAGRNTGSREDSNAFVLRVPWRENLRSSLYKVENETLENPYEAGPARVCDF
jgi:hypothetical protein